MLIAQIVAVAIFIIMFLFIITEKIERHYATLGCGLATLLLVFGVCMRDFGAAWKTLNISSIFTSNFWLATGEAASESGGINWATIIFIAGMMIMVEGMAASGFFRWLCITIAKAVHFKVIPTFILFMIMSAILAMFIDSITVILFLAAVTIELAQLLRFNPVPMILAEIFCANLGGSATMCGDPPNIIIGTSLSYSFGDFISNTGLISLIALIIVILYFYLVFRKELRPEIDASQIDMSAYSNIITNKKNFAISCIIFFLAIVLLVTHAMTGLTVATIGVFISILTLIVAGKSTPALLKRVDYKTLLFFIGLFVVVGGLEQTGVLDVIANFIGNISGGNPYIMIAIIIWVSGIASAFIDNIPFAATMVPIIQNLAQSTGVGLPILAWALALGTDIGGSATPIGASANVVGTSVAAKEGHPIGWKKYCKAMAPITIIVLTIAMFVIWTRYIYL